MAIRNIVTEEDEILTKPCRRVEKFDARLHQIIDDMKETLQAAQGAGLAAPQVTYIMHDLDKSGIPVRTDVTTVSEAADEIVRMLHREKEE